jgi:hypothetical protein
VGMEYDGGQLDTLGRSWIAVEHSLRGKEQEGMGGGGWSGFRPCVRSGLRRGAVAGWDGMLRRFSY